MAKKNQSAVEGLSARIAEQRPKWSAGTHRTFARRLVSAARVIHRGNERECNDATYSAENDSARIDAEREAHAIAEALGVKLELNSDPRGFALKLYFDNERSNSWETGVWGV